MPDFVKSIVIQAPVETVFGFHEREDALPLLSPPFPPMRVVGKTGGMEIGARVELSIGGVPWTALHTAFVKNRFFEDRQIAGPFAEWVHRHEFESVQGGTRLTDRVHFRLPGGVWSNRLLSPAVKLGLLQMFHYRHRVTKRHCERGTGADRG